MSEPLLKNDYESCTSEDGDGGITATPSVSSDDGVGGSSPSSTASPSPPLTTPASLNLGEPVPAGIDQKFMRKLLKCANCSKTCAAIPIYQCQKEGHLICSSCRSRSFWFPNCDACGTSMLQLTKINTRNRVAEAIWGELVVQCLYERYGCKETMKQEALGNHLMGCSFGLNLFCYNMTRLEVKLRDKFGFSEACPMFSATENTKMIQHLQREHGLSGTITGKLSYNLDDALNKFGTGKHNRYDYLHYTQFDGKLFILKTKLDWFKKEISWKVLFLGSPETSMKYRVRIGTVFQPWTSDAKSDTAAPRHESRRCKVEWEGGPFSFYAGWKRKSFQKFELPWSTFKTQRKRLEIEMMAWVVYLDVTSLGPAAVGDGPAEPGVNPPPYETSVAKATPGPKS